MHRWLAALLGLILALFVAVPAAMADIDNASATNVQEGDNDDENDQSGEAESGDAVAGQVVGVQSSGDASVDATNTTRDSSATSGDASGENVSLSFVGQDGAGGPELTAADLASGDATNVQAGDNSADVEQSTRSISGDAVAGQVSGIVTAVGGTADVVLANTTIDSDVESGDADADSTAITVVGLIGGSPDSSASGLALVISDASALEGDPLTFRVSLVASGRAQSAADTVRMRGDEEPPQNQGVCFTYETNDGTAQGKADYAPSSGGGCIPPGSNSTTIFVSTFFDQDCPKADETMTVILTSSQGAPIADGTGVGTIRDFCK